MLAEIIWFPKEGSTTARHVDGLLIGLTTICGAVGLLVAYLPKQKLLIQADTYIPRPGAPPLPAPSPYTISLVDNVARLKLDVARVVHIHGGISPFSEVVAAAGRQPERAALK